MSRQSLIDNHQRAAEHSVASAKFHKSMSEHFSNLAEMSKATEGMEGPSGVLQSIGEEHAAQSDEHTANAEFHLQCCKDLAGAAKSMMHDDDGELAPTRISVLAPTVPQNGGVRPVYRVGQRQVGTEEVNVSEQFRKLVTVDDGDLE